MHRYIKCKQTNAFLGIFQTNQNGWILRFNAMNHIQYIQIIPNFVKSNRNSSLSSFE